MRNTSVILGEFKPKYPLILASILALIKFNLPIILTKYFYDYLGKRLVRFHCRKELLFFKIVAKRDIYVNYDSN